MIRHRHAGLRTPRLPTLVTRARSRACASRGEPSCELATGLTSPVSPCQDSLGPRTPPCGALAALLSSVDTCAAPMTLRRQRRAGTELPATARAAQRSRVTPWHLAKGVTVFNLSSLASSWLHVDVAAPLLTSFRVQQTGGHGCPCTTSSCSCEARTTVCAVLPALGPRLSRWHRLVCPARSRRYGRLEAAPRPRPSGCALFIVSVRVPATTVHWRPCDSDLVRPASVSFGPDARGGGGSGCGGREREREQEQADKSQERAWASAETHWASAQLRVPAEQLTGT